MERQAGSRLAHVRRGVRLATWSRPAGLRYPNGRIERSIRRSPVRHPEAYRRNKLGLITVLYRVQRRTPPPRAPAGNARLGPVIRDRASADEKKRECNISAERARRPRCRRSQANAWDDGQLERCVPPHCAPALRGDRVSGMIRPVSEASPAVESTAEDSTGTSAPSSETTWTWLRSMFKDDFGSLQPRLLLAALLVSPLPRHSFNRCRTVLYRTAGLRLGAGTVVFDCITLSGPGDVLSRFKVGRGCIINGPFFADLNAEVIIGDGVSIGHHAIFITAGHTIGPAFFRAGTVNPEPIRVGDGVLIGARVTVLPGVTIGHGSVIAAGSLVAGDVAPNKLVGGNPARVIKALPEVP